MRTESKSPGPLPVFDRNESQREVWTVTDDLVRVLICYDEDADWVPIAPREYNDCPVRVWLDKPLGERAVIYVDSDEELPLFIPAYRDRVLDARHGYYPSNRRRHSRKDEASG